MRRSVRCSFFFAGAAVLAVVLISAFLQLPPLGQYRGPYGDIVNRSALPERHVTNSVTAVNFDIRGFDTFGEEYIFFTAVMGVLLLLRRLRSEQHTSRPVHFAHKGGMEPSAAVRVLCMLLVAPTVLFGVYVVVHGQLTPGGGFQGGAILAGVLVLALLAGQLNHPPHLMSRSLVEIIEATGAAGYVFTGCAALIGGGVFLQNVLPLGSIGSVTSGGTIALIDLVVGMEVAAGFILLLTTYLTATLEDP